MPDTRPLAGGRRFYGDPSLCDPPEHIGRPRRHRPMMKCSDPSTWPEPSTEHRCEDAGYGAVRVRAWAELHPKVHNHDRRGDIHCQDADRARLRPQSGPADEVPGGTRSHRGRCRARRPGVRGRVDECHVQGSSASLDAKTRKPCKTTTFPDASLRAGMQRLGLLTCRSQVRIPPGATICPSPAATTLGAAFRKNAVPCCRRCLCDRLATSSSRRGRAWWQERAECG